MQVLTSRIVGQNPNIDFGQVFLPDLRCAPWCTPPKRLQETEWKVLRAGWFNAYLGSPASERRRPPSFLQWMTLERREPCYHLQQSRGDDDKNRLARLFRAGSRCVAMGGLIRFPRATPPR